MTVTPTIRKTHAGTSRGIVDYSHFDDLWQGYDDLLVELAQQEGAKAVAELGGGAKPIIADKQRWGFVSYRVAVDISADELAKAAGDVDKRVVDLCQPINDGLNSYDMVFSKMLCEHLPDPRTFHENCFKLLRPGGLAVHFFPTLYSLPYAVNLMIPEKLARSALRKIQPGRIDDPKHEKFPAYYRWATGPTKRAMRRFESVGFEVEQWHAAFGHYYYHFIPGLRGAEKAKTKLLLRHPAPLLTSFAAVVLRKPAGDGRAPSR